MPYIGKRIAARKIQRAYRRFRLVRGYRAGVRKGRAIRRTVGLGNPTPTFVETYAGGMIAPNVGQCARVRITDIPQIAQYAALYKQYRINWVKLMLLPQFDSTSADANAANYNNSVPVPLSGMARIAYAIQDSPDVGLPANENEVLEMNGAKVKALGSKFSVSFKPVPDTIVGTSATNQIYTRQKFRQWFNFDLVTTGNNPAHGAVPFWITQLVTAGAFVGYNVYFKVSFTLRDPQ